MILGKSWLAAKLGFGLWRDLGGPLRRSPRLCVSFEFTSEVGCNAINQLASGVLLVRGGSSRNCQNNLFPFASHFALITSCLSCAAKSIKTVQPLFPKRNIRNPRSGPLIGSMRHPNPSFVEGFAATRNRLLVALQGKPRTSIVRNVKLNRFIHNLSD